MSAQVVRAAGGARQPPEDELDRLDGSLPWLGRIGEERYRNARTLE